MQKRLLLLITIALFALSACSKPAAQDKAAVQKALTEYLAAKAGLSLDSMEMDVTSVTFRGNEADAQVTFRAKGSSDASNLMQMRYVLEQKDGKWTVKGRSGMSDHGGPGAGSTGTPAMPPGHPPMDKQGETGNSAGEKK